MRFKHVAFKHGVVRITAHVDAVVLKNMQVVLEVLAELLRALVFQPGLQARQHFIQRQLRWRIGTIVRQRHVGGLQRLNGKTDANDARAHGVE